MLIYGIYRVPVLVIVTNQMQDMRFFKIGQIAPFHLPMSDLLENRERWESMPIWRGQFAPGGSRYAPFISGRGSVELTSLRSAWILVPLGNYWAAYHRYMSKIPGVVMLLLSGMMMNFVVGLVSRSRDVQNGTLSPG